jgi:hypothetical protein
VTTTTSVSTVVSTSTTGPVPQRQSTAPSTSASSATDTPASTPRAGSGGASPTVVHRAPIKAVLRHDAANAVIIEGSRVVEAGQPITIRVLLGHLRLAHEGLVVVKLGRTVLCRVRVRGTTAKCAVKPLPGPVQKRRGRSPSLRIRRYVFHLFYEGRNGARSFSRFLIVDVRSANRRSAARVRHVLQKRKGKSQKNRYGKHPIETSKKT